LFSCRINFLFHSIKCRSGQLRAQYKRITIFPLHYSNGLAGRKALCLWVRVQGHGCRQVG
jgi:hypothetical protein